MAEAETVQTYSNLLIMHGETDKNAIIRSYCQFFNEFGQCLGSAYAVEALETSSGPLYVMQAKTFDAKKLEEAKRFCKDIFCIGCVAEEETKDIQLWMLELAESIDALAHFRNVPMEEPGFKYRDSLGETV